MVINYIIFHFTLMGSFYIKLGNFKKKKEKKKEKRSVNFKMCFIKKDIKGRELVPLLKCYVLY